MQHPGACLAVLSLIKGVKLFQSLVCFALSHGCADIEGTELCRCQGVAAAASADGCALTNSQGRRSITTYDPRQHLSFCSPHITGSEGGVGVGVWDRDRRLPTEHRSQTEIVDPLGY